MAYVYSGGALDYAPCHYGMSRVAFRGPAHDLRKPYLAVLGGTETYGKFVPEPYPTLVAAEEGLGVVNLGAVNAGVDLYLNEPDLLRIARGAEAVILQVVGAHNLSNRFYRVHRRRNDRFLGASPALRSLYPEVDFTEFSFTRHMLQALQQTSPERFCDVVAELRMVWLQRMQHLIRQLPPRLLLLWFAARRPCRFATAVEVTLDPMLVDSEMIAALTPHVAAYIEVITAPTARVGNGDCVAFSAMEEPAAHGVPGPAAHREAANRLARALRHS
ncbi:DUF6473 family protein [Gemmobacter serpentinus]|uniref:DUF6473 family protein n=1 Tax=Gemmobacter serpentinus TaxID=2652247 RepID=UPI00124EE312|nr:DUF6473 family protein [Gemmobacter serpentinus]